jgi:predicted ATPase
MRWHIKVANYRCFNEGNPFFIDLSKKVTSLIGPNNVGKTACLKIFWELGQTISSSIGVLLSDNSAGQRVHFGVLGRILTTPSSMFNQYNDRPIIFEMQYKKDTDLENQIEADSVLPIRYKIFLDRNSSQFYTELHHNGNFIITDRQNFEVFQSGESMVLRKKDKTVAYYYDVIHSIGLSNPTFIPSLRAVGNVNLLEQFELQLGNTAIGVWNHNKRADDAQQRIYCAKIEEELASIFRFRNVDIYTNNSDTDFIVRINNGKSFLMREMGHGFSHFFSILMNIMNRGNHLVLIDEPEMGLHPRLQIDLMNSISKFSRGPIVVATHSMGLALSTSDQVISIGQAEGQSKPKIFSLSENHLEMLGEMSFSAYRDLGCDGVLFLEGVNDVRVFREWLRKLELQDEWVLVPIGGSSGLGRSAADALAEVIKVHHNIAVIIDSEILKDGESISKNRLDFLKACRNAGIKAHATERRATENYFTQKAIDISIANNGRSLQKFEKFSPAVGWNKSDGAKIASAMTREEIESTDIGAFLRSLKAGPKSKPAPPAETPSPGSSATPDRTPPSPASAARDRPA